MEIVLVIALPGVEKKPLFFLYINDTKMEKMVPFFCNLYHVKKTLFTIKIFKVYLGSFVQKKNDTIRV